MTHTRPLISIVLSTPLLLALPACGSGDGGGGPGPKVAGAAGAGEPGALEDADGDVGSSGEAAGAHGNEDDGSGGKAGGTAAEGMAGGRDDSTGGTQQATGGTQEAAGETQDATGGVGDGATGGTTAQGMGGSTSASGGQSTGGEGSNTGGAAAGTAGDLDEWYAAATVSKRNLLPVPAASTNLMAEPIRQQLEIYDPGSLLRCEVHDDAAYRELIDSLGGVTWGYPVTLLEDESKPRFQLGFPDERWLAYPATDAGNAASEVEIEESDIIGISETSALYYSNEHGLLLVDLSGPEPVFDCATKLPGRVDKFFYYQGHLVAMTQQLVGSVRHSYLLHFAVSDGALSFVEAIDLGAVRILDTRRFNGRLVVYTDLTLEDQSSEPPADGSAPIYYEPRGLHRMLRVFTFGETLTEEMTDTLLDTSPSSGYLTDGGVAPETEPGSLVVDSSNFGSLMWASDHYFVVTEQIAKTYLTSWTTRTYSVCVESHTVEIPYQHCNTIYEERPNPDYTPPDNSGGDRACNGTTLSDCLRAVSRASNPTIQVPVGKECEQRIRQHWICDARESRSYTYPELDTEYSNRLYIYEYTDDGFIRLDTEVSEITNEGLEQQSSDAVVPALTTSTETYDLSIPGMLQTLYFQNDMLYAIADGVLQTYAMGGSSLVRTSSLSVVDSSLQTSLFTSDKLYLSDFGYSGGHDQSVLRVIDLSNPAFPSQASEDRTLPGGHSTILPVSQGILTVGTVANFEPGIQQVIKLGMFSDPFTDELSYLILGTDLETTYLGETKSLTFDSSAQRLFLPYYGYTAERTRQVARVGVSHLDGTSIVSEGAVVTPELPRRVRRRPGATDEVLSFATSSIEWLRPEAEEWAATPVLEYFTPVALYRLTEEDDYIEVLRLGEECKLHFSAADSINLTREESTSDVFECGGSYPWAYANNIVFSTVAGVEFASDGTVRVLSEDEVAALYDLRAERQYCLFSRDLLPDVVVDYENPPAVDGLVCYAPEEYQTAYQEALGQGEGA